MDLDHFKTVNDTHGHQAGDRVLINFVDTVNALLRRPDYLARFGGEEFVALLPETSREEAVLVAERISGLKFTPLAKGWRLARPLRGLIDLAHALPQQACSPNDASMGDPHCVTSGLPGLVPGNGHTLHELLHALPTAKAMPSKVDHPAVKVGLWNCVPALAFPAAKVHLHQACIKFICQIGP
jgi:hypothetical protein